MCAPLGSHMSEWPPVMLTMFTEMCIRGPTSSPSSTARLIPASAPAASRTVVIPSSRIHRSVSATLKKRYVNGSWTIRVMSKSSWRDATWMWQSNSPGRSAFPVTSTPSSPSRPGPTSTIRPPSMTTSA